MKNSIVVNVPYLGMLTLIIFSLSGCKSIPDNMHVREGVSPRGQDDQVRFRTTYYFRTFDFCQDLDDQIGSDTPGSNTIPTPGPKKESRKQILHDTMYRFRMTGKAAALFNKVHFEAGTLRKHQIDPFGSTIEFDAKANRFRYKSQEKNEAAAIYDDIWREIYRLKSFKVPDGSTLASKIDVLIEQYLDRLAPGDTFNLAAHRIVIVDRLKELNKEISSYLAEADAAKRQASLAKIETLSELLKKLDVNESTPPPPLGCSNKLPARRGFQVLGPEGWRTFDPDERLILAMSSSAKPLVDTLREISDRVLQQEAKNGVGHESILRERLVTLRAKQEISATSDVVKSTEATIKAFESETETAK